MSPERFVAYVKVMFKSFMNEIKDAIKTEVKSKSPA
jgi:hypothetical protein